MAIGPSVFEKRHLSKLQRFFIISTLHSGFPHLHCVLIRTHIGDPCPSTCLVDWTIHHLAHNLETITMSSTVDFKEALERWRRHFYDGAVFGLQVSGLGVTKDQLANDCGI